MLALTKFFLAPSAGRAIEHAQEFERNPGGPGSLNIAPVVPPYTWYRAWLIEPGEQARAASIRGSTIGSGSGHPIGMQAVEVAQ
jgi:hypothetical protein